jgi:DNA helicase-2/ATP-dependent DNA helicase PcrA
MTLTLTDEQDAIITAPIGHYVISAVAGSGKTTTLAHRIRFLLEQGISSKRIVILMFNRSAREDFQRKLSLVLQEPSTPGAQNQQYFSSPEVRTFHAMAYRLYKRFIQEGYLPAFNSNILSEKEQDFQIWKLLNHFLSGDQLQDLKRHKKDHIEICRNFIETVKSGLQTPQIVFEDLDLEPKFNYVLELFERFEVWRKQEARISYSDMLYDTVLAIRNFPQLKALVENKMNILLVDEYQDTNDIQHALLKYIAGDRAKITVVGDPDQTIYEFRGAKPEYIIKGFSEEFSDASMLSLSYSFRYGHAVSLLANHLISKNTNRLPVLCKSHTTNPNTEIHLHRSIEDASEISKYLLGSNHQYLKDTAILVRVWSQTVSIELALLEAEIPYHIDGHLGVFHSKEIQAIRALLELSAGLFSTFQEKIRQEKFELICQFPHIGLPEYQLKQLCQVLAVNDQRYGEQLLQNNPSEIKQFQQRKLERLAKVLNRIEDTKATSSDVLRLYSDETELYDGIRSLSFNHEQAEEKVRSISSIIAFVSNQGKFPIDVLKLLDELAQKSEYKHSESVKISSIHRAKGLEWQHVLVPGLNKKTFPHSLNPEKITYTEIESERRLLYVAMTRAKQSLHLFGPIDQSIEANKKSRFEKELNFDQSNLFAKHIYSESNNAFSIKNQGFSNILRKYADAMRFSIEETDLPKGKNQNQDALDLSHIQWKGQWVEHCLLGRGLVIEDKPSAFIVEFESKDRRTFSKEFAGRFFTLLNDKSH